MNKIRLFGVMLLAVGVMLQFYGVGFLSGLLTGAGIAFLITGKVKKRVA